MDGSNYYRRELPLRRDTRAENRAAVHVALLMTVAMAIVTVGVLLGLGAAGVTLPTVSEFQIAE